MEKEATAIEIRNLVKKFGTLTAVDNLSLDVRRGEVFGFLGPNGAGKTTTLKAISGLLKSEDGEVTDGQIQFLGKRIDKKHPENIVRMGIFQVMEGHRVFEHLTVEENLIAGASLLYWVTVPIVGVVEHDAYILTLLYVQHWGSAGVWPALDEIPELARKLVEEGLAEPGELRALLGEGQEPVATRDQRPGQAAKEVSRADAEALSLGGLREERMEGVEDRRVAVSVDGRLVTAKNATRNAKPAAIRGCLIDSRLIISVSSFRYPRSSGPL